MKKYRVWIGLAVLCVIVGVPQLTWKPSRFGGIFLLALAVGCTGEWLMLRGCEKYRACRVLSRAGQMLFGLFVLTFALVQVCIIGVSFEENDPSAAPKADYYLTLGALVNPDGQPSAALAARCDAAIGVLNANQDSRAILCGGQGGDEPRTEAEAMQDYMVSHGADPERLILEDNRVRPSRISRTRKSFCPKALRSPLSRTITTSPAPAVCSHTQDSGTPAFRRKRRTPVNGRRCAAGNTARLWV